jgi:hypothetical protein
MMQTLSSGYPTPGTSGARLKDSTNLRMEPTRPMIQPTG